MRPIETKGHSHTPAKATWFRRCNLVPTIRCLPFATKGFPAMSGDGEPESHVSGSRPGVPPRDPSRAARRRQEHTHALWECCSCVCQGAKEKSWTPSKSVARGLADGGNVSVPPQRAEISLRLLNLCGDGRVGPRLSAAWELASMRCLSEPLSINL